MLQHKIYFILYDWISVTSYLILASNIARGIFVMNVRVGKLSNHIARINDPKTNVCFIQEVFILFVKSTDFKQRRATERGITSQEVWKAIAFRK